MKRWEIIFLALCAFAAARPLFHQARPTGAYVVSAGFPGWSAAPIPAGLTPLALQERERKLAGKFPGEIGVFSDGHATWIVRWIAQPSRKLHPVTDCLRGTGYTVNPKPVFASNDGTHWGVNAARRANEELLVKERIVDSHGKEFTDVSAWFWSAVFETSSGPWWSVTRLESVAGRSL